MLALEVERRLGEFRVEAGFRVPAQGVTALFGPSGSGKTSLVNMLAGLLRPQTGRILLEDRVLFDSRAGVDVPPQKRRVGYVFQDGRLFPHLTVRGNLLYGRPRGRGGGPDQGLGLEQVVELLGIGHLLGRRPGRLSGGERQRVAIGRALLRRPRLLLMDEPLASLDQGRKQELLPFIQRLARSCDLPIIYVTHSWEEIARLAHTVVTLEGGRVVSVRGLAPRPPGLPGNR